jgi:hypothetical protein
MIELTSTQLRRAAEIKDKIESLQSELNRLLGNNASAASKGKMAAPKKRTMSAAARAKISAAAKARWAKVKAKK